MNAPPRSHDDDAGRVLRPSAEATQEVRAEDVLEAIAIDVRARAPSEPSVRHDDGASIAPVALAIYSRDYSRDYAFGPDDSLSGGVRYRARRAPNPRLVATVGAALGVCIVILAAAGIRTALGSSDDGASVAAAAVANGTSALPASTGGALSVDSLPPAPTSGTIVFPKRGSVTLDGTRVTSTSAVVRCGDHTVRVGRGPARKIDVPCGGTLDLESKPIR